MASLSLNEFTLNTNLPAILAGNQLQINQLNLSRSILRLSTGLRINTPADDVAGNDIAQQLGANLSILNQGTLNAQDAVSLIQTAEGGLSQITAILQQINSLATSAASTTVTSTTASGIQTQINQLLNQINQIVNETRFGNQPLLDGSIANVQAAVPSTLYISSNAFLGASATNFVLLNTVAPALLNQASFLDEAFQFVIAGVSGFPNSVEVQIFASGTSATTPITTVVFNSFANQLVTVTSTAGGTFLVSLQLGGLTTSDIPNIVGQEAFFGSTAFQAAITTSKSLAVQIGGNLGNIQEIFSPDALTAALFSNQSVNVTTFLGAEAALVQVSHALDIADAASSALGALQNNFQSTITVNQIYQENLTAAKSSITDVNVAQETTNLVQEQVLVQTNTAVLAQANLAPAAFLQLIRAI